MATVMVSIDGKSYRMACEEGQELHLTQLAGRLDRYIRHLKASFGEIGDHRLSVMAGIMVMDEMVELEARLAALEAENRSLSELQSKNRVQISHNEHHIAERIEAVTQRVEMLASHLLSKNEPQE